jgi:hypothetical protein
MYKLIIILFFGAIVQSCSIDGKKRCKTSLEKCVIKSVKYQYRYGGLTNEITYTYKTENGYTVSSEKEQKVGDTIVVKVVDCRTKSKKI